MDKLDIAKEAVKIYFYQNISPAKAIEKAKDLFETDQSKQIDPNKNDFNDILPPGTDLDNNEIYNEHTGETIGEF